MVEKAGLLSIQKDNFERYYKIWWVAPNGILLADGSLGISSNFFATSFL
jgi:hypothetical protein